MQLEPIIQALRTRCPIFANNVAGAADFKVLEEATNLPVPCAFVIPLDDNPEDNTSGNSIRQSLTDILAPRAGKRFLLTERQSLLNYGIATSFVSGGVLRVERAITTYQKNAFNQADPSYLDSETLHTLTEVTRRLRSRITQKYPRHKLANDGTRFGAGQAIVTPSVIRGELLAEYADMEQLGLVENAALFAKYLIVERDGTNPSRLNVLLPPDLVNQLRIFAVLNQFRLQYPATA